MSTLKYTETQVTFSEVPEEITLCINISGCPLQCKGCHSPYLWEDVGTDLEPVILSDLIAKNPGVTCVAFMGGDAAPEEIEALARWVKNNTKLKVCWYSGVKNFWKIQKSAFTYLDYLKTGPYIEERGGLSNPNTNQRFYRIKHVKGLSAQFILDDITSKFQNNETENKSKSID